MDWSPIPDDDWQALTHERESFCNVYIDESSLSHRYLVLGALVVPLTHAGLFESDITEVRSKTNRPIARSNGTPRVMKWEKVSAGSVDAYQALVKGAFDFRIVRNLKALKEMSIHALAIDTSAKPLLRTGKGDRETCFEIELNFLAGVVVSNFYRRHLFALYPDRRIARRRLYETRDIMNWGAYKHKDQRKFPFRRLHFADPEVCQGLQIVDVFIGALAYRLNRHYEQLGANPAKKELCDYIWQLCKLGDPFNNSPFQQKRFMTWMHRPEPPNAPKSGPQNKR
jgi:hypothetical protein